ncbi:glucose dehydrogenase [FAD, quinone]-like isoform X2 [Daktulosphaira vitifoliae]|nr:glucose dehydrogenase [FAD, quinone]-like isoform X2 [Daktulosphaira vitifoliae]XP_050519819.1 glucose dehydrogenase [FAD, quinone]-like isoform X2 [Daktulosphaira vitifoliae]
MDLPALAGVLQTMPINWKYKTVPMNNSCLAFNEKRCKFPRGKVMGGCSTLNYMIYTRGNWRDYDNWSKMGNLGWNYNDVLKYFIKSENAELPQFDTKYHGINGPLTVSTVPFRTPISNAFVEASRDIGLPIIDYNGKHQIGVNYFQVTMKKGHRCSTNKAFINPAINRPNLTIKKNSLVTKILFDQKEKKAIGVEFQTGLTKYQVFVKKEVIVSGGAINSPQLLMLSGIGPKKHLEEINIPLVKDLPVGENLMDHVALGSLTVLVNDTISLKSGKLIRDPKNLYNYVTNHDGPLTVPGGTEALVFFDTLHPNDPNGYPDLELLLVSGLYSSDDLVHTLFGLKKDIYDKVYKPTHNKDGFVVLPMILRPKSKGRLWLNDSNPLHYPLIDPNYFSDETDLDVAVAGVRIVQKMLKTEPMKKLGARLLHTPIPGCTQYHFDTDKYWKCSAKQISFTIYHLSGTCKMGPHTDVTAVVSPRLVVHGIKNLRVIDASIIPEIPAAHTNAPAIMIGEKGADMIKEDWSVHT